MIKKLKHFKKKLLDKIKNIKIKGLVTIALVGSFQSAKSLKQINDVDLVIIFKKLTPVVFSKLNKEFKKIADAMSEEKIKCMVENRLGPLKPQPIENKKVIQLHLLPYDYNSWEKKKSVAATLDWVLFHTVVKGKSLNYMSDIKKLSKEEVIYDLQVNLNNTLQKAAYTREYYAHDGKLESKKMYLDLSQLEYYENISWNVITSMLNYIRYYKPKTPKNKKIILKNARKLIPDEKYSTLDFAFEIRDCIKLGKKPKIKISEFRRTATNFINYLKSKINSS